jgi:predicted MFS family arabinose efflux permease
VTAVGVAALPQVVVPADPAPAAARRDRPDVFGAVTVTAGVLALVFAVSRAATSGWLVPLTLGPLVAGVLLLALFVQVERVVRAPLLPLGILARPRLAAANTCMLFQGCYVGFQFVATLYYQNRLGWSPLEAGLAFVVGGLIVAGAARWFAGLVRRYGAWPLATAGLALQVVGYAWFAVAVGHVGAIPLLLVQQLLGGTGFAAAYPALNITAVASADEDEQGLASGLFIAASQIGIGLVVGVTAAVFASFAGAGLAGYRAALWFVIAVTAAVTVLAATRSARPRGGEAGFR